MLILPDRCEMLRVVGVDPGTSYMGISCLEWDFVSPLITVAKAQTLMAKDSRIPYCNVSELHGGRVGRLMNLGDQFANFLADYKPHAVVVEGNYLGASVDSFRALVESVCMVRNTLYQYDPYSPLYTVDPRTVKMIAGVKGRPKGDEKKLAVREALRIHPDLNWTFDIDDLDEHAVDGTAIGLYYIKQLLIAS